MKPVYGHLDLLILATLDDDELHGYALIERLRDKSDGLFALAEGTLYPALHRLEREGWLKSRWDGQAARRRRVYRVTAAGRKQLASERLQWRAFARGVAGVLR